MSMQYVGLTPKYYNLEKSNNCFIITKKKHRVYSVHLGSIRIEILGFLTFEAIRHFRTGMYHVYQHQISGKLGLNWGTQLQFKCGLEQNTFRNLRPACKGNLWKYMEAVQHCLETQKSALRSIQPKVEIERFCTQATIWGLCDWQDCNQHIHFCD